MKLICDKNKPPLSGLITAEYLKLTHKLDITWGNKTVIENGQKSINCSSSNDVCRALARLLAETELYGSNAVEKTQVDHWLSFSIGPLSNKHEFSKSIDYLNKILSPVTYLTAKRLTIADFAVFSALYVSKDWKLAVEKNEIPDHVQRWFDFISSQRAVKNVLENLSEEIKNALTPSVSSKQSVGCSTAKPVLDKSVTGQRKQEGTFVDLPGAEMGKVVVRFPPEASGYLHIGHAKAALLNQYYQQAFQGKLIMRFDDTNPAKENVHFEQVILEDLKMLEIKPDLFTHTSNYFDLMIEYCERLIKENKAYVDDTDPELMKQQREQKMESENRNNSVEKNLSMWEEMKKGTEIGQKCCVRAKIDMQSLNGCMRDPTIYRCKNEIHPRTGDKYKVYPTYDFACPIVDAIENVTHTLRTMEYHDRDAQFYWFIEALGLRRPIIWEYSRLSMTNTVLSKRKLTWFVQEGLVDGWDDPRFPTVRGVLRRGMTVEGLKQFIIAQGSSRSVVFMEWDKIWAFNKKVIDPIAPRYTAVDFNYYVPVLVSGVKLEKLSVPLHPKNSDIGNKDVWIGPRILIDYEDAVQLKEGENTTFINWGNLLIRKINRENDKIISVEAEPNLENKDYKKTLKLTWLCETDQAQFTPCYCVYFDHIINKPVLAKDEDFKKYIGHETRTEVQMLGDPELKKLKKGDIIQLQRRGFFKVDVAYEPANETCLKTTPVILFSIPDGHTKENPLTIIQKQKKVADIRTASVLVPELLKQEEVVKNLKANKSDKNAIEIAENILLNLKKEFKLITDLDWHDKRIICQATEVSNNSASGQATLLSTITEEIVQAEKNPNQKALLAELLEIKNKFNLGSVVKTEVFAEFNNIQNINLTKIIEQGDKIRDLESSKAEKSVIESEVKVLLALQADYKITNLDDRIRVLKSKNAQKSVIDIEIKTLLTLLADYKNLTGKDWKPGTIASKTNESVSISVQSTVPTLNNEREILNKITLQGDKIRDLKAKKVEKSIIETEVKILLALKADYKNLTGKDWKPGTVVSKLTESSTLPSGEENEILNKIAVQGEKVRDLKAKKSEKSVIETEVKILLALKSDYKNLTGKDWKPGTVVSKPTESAPVSVQSSAPIVLDNEIEILDKIAAQFNWSVVKTEVFAENNNIKNIKLTKIIEQGDKIRDLESSKAEKSVIESEVKVLSALQADFRITNLGDRIRDLKSKNAQKSVIDIEIKTLLTLLADYKNLTGKDWKPGTIASKTNESVSISVQSTVPTLNNEREILNKITLQGDKIRDLKAKKVEKSIIETEVKILLALKADYKNLTGKDWKPGTVVSKLTESSTLPSGEENEILNKIAVQGEKVRDLKAKKSEKSVIETEVKILLALKSDYKNLTGKDWKPGTVVSKPTESAPVSVQSSAPIVLDNEIEILNKIAAQGDKVRDLKAKKAEKTVIEVEVKNLLTLKADYKTLTGKDWKPDTLTQKMSTKNASGDNSAEDSLTKKITEQGNVVRNLKSSSASKSEIDAAVKTLLELKAEYKTLTGTDFPVPSRTQSKPKDPKLVANKKAPIKEKKPVDEDSGVKKQTRLGLEAKKEENLSDWYSQVITKGEMIEYYDVSGCYIYRPWSYAIWELIKNWFDDQIKKLGVQNCYFPIFVSKSVLEKEKTHIADFAPEVAWVTKSGDSDMAEPIAVRPTSETVMYPAYAKWIQSYRDLPIKLNQWNNVVRWEFKHPQPFLRTREFLWQEGHTAYANLEEACDEVSTILDLYARIYTDLLAIPVIKGRKTEKEKFAGGDYTLTVEAYVSASGRAIQGATSHHLGQNFSKMFDITFEDPDTQEKKFVYQNSWGITTRTIGVMIMIHADNQGLVLPPEVASVQIVIVPCGITVSLSDDDKTALQQSCDSLESDLKSAGIRIKGDYRNNYSPGWKFNHWELKGVPIRIELGPKDMKNNQLVAVRRDTGEKVTIKRENAVVELTSLLKTIQQNLYNKALSDINQHKMVLKDWSQFTKNLDNKNIILAPFCGDITCEDRIKADSARDDAEVEPGAPAMGAKSLCIPLEQPTTINASDKCIHPSCTRKPQYYTLFGRSY